MGLFDFFKKNKNKKQEKYKLGMHKTRENSFGSIKKILAARNTIDDELFDELEEVKDLRKFKGTNRERYEKMNKVLIPVEMYIDGESGYLYLVPREDVDLKKEFGLKIEEWFENLKKICYNIFEKWN